MTEPAAEPDPLAELAPDALHLAIRASAAAHVDAGLLRWLRLQFLPAADAAIEADVWHSDAIASETSNGISFTAEALDTLRARLGQTAWVRETCDAIAAYHEGGPPLLLLEEELVRHALAGDTAKVEAELLRVLASLEREADTRASAILHWAKQALPRLPAAAQATTAAWTLALATQRHIGRQVLPGTPPAGLAGIDLGAYLPTADVELCVRGVDGGLVFGGAGGLTITVPDTHPRIVTLVRGTTRTIVSVAAGHEARVESVTLPVELGDLRGRRWRVREGPADAAAEPVVVRFLVLSDLRLAPDSIESIQQGLDRLTRALRAPARDGRWSGELDQAFVVGNVVDGGAATDDSWLHRVERIAWPTPRVTLVPGPTDVSGGVRAIPSAGRQLAALLQRGVNRPDASPRDTEVPIVGTDRWFARSHGLPGDVTRAFVKQDHRVSVICLNTIHGTVDTSAAFEHHLGAVLQGDLPALWREEVDAAVLVSAYDPAQVGYRRSTAGDAALALFDVRVCGERHGEGHAEDGRVDEAAITAPSFWRARQGEPCALVIELTFEQRRLRSIRNTSIDLDGRIVETATRAIDRRPRLQGSRATVRREILRHLHASCNVLVVGAQAAGKTTLLAEIARGPWLDVVRAPSVDAALELAPGPDAVAAELDAGEDLAVLSEPHAGVPLLVASSVLPLKEPPELDPSWRICTLGRLDHADVLDALAHVDDARRAAIATWLLEQTGGSPWLVWRAIAGARLHGASDLASYAAPLAQAASASVSKLGDPAAIELLAALRAGPRWPVDPRAKWRLEDHGLAHMQGEALALTSPVVGRVVDEYTLDRLRRAVLGALPDHAALPERWVWLNDQIPDAWTSAMAMALAIQGHGLLEDNDHGSSLRRALARLSGDAWIRIGDPASAQVAISIGERTPPLQRPSLIIAPGLGPDQVFVVVSEALESMAATARQEDAGRPLSALLGELGVLDPGVVTVRPDVPRKAVRRERIAEVRGATSRIRVTDNEARRLIAAGARPRQGSRNAPKPEDTRHEDLAEDFAGEAPEGS